MCIQKIYVVAEIKLFGGQPLNDFITYHYTINQRNNVINCFRER